MPESSVCEHLCHSHCHNPKRVSRLCPPPLHSLITAPRVSPDITPRGPGEAEAISRAVHGGDVWAAFGKFGHMPGMGPEDRHAPPAKSNSEKGQEWGGSQAKEPGLKSLPTGLPVPSRPAPAQRGWQRGGSSPGQGDPTVHPDGQGSPDCSIPFAASKGIKDMAPTQPIGNAPSRASVLAGTVLAPLRDTWGHVCLHRKPELPPCSFVPQHLQQAPATSCLQEGSLRWSLSQPSWHP